MSNALDVVVTGIGVVSPIGIGNEPFWRSIAEGTSGVRRLSLIDASNLPVPIGAEVLDFEPKKYVRPRKSMKVMSREIQIGFSAGMLAIEHAGIEKGSVTSERLGVIYGCDMLYTEPVDLVDGVRLATVDGTFQHDRWDEQAISKIYPLWMLKYLPNMVACHVGIALDARGPNNSIVSGDVSSLLALMEATSVIQRGHADFMIVGGAGSRLNLTRLLWRSSKQLSHRIDEPESASRPFDRLRDGTVNGEGAAAFVLESRQHAERRGATPLAKVVGFAFASAFETPSDGFPREGTAIRATIRQAMRSADLSVEQLSHVNAHSFGGVLEDAVEAKAIHAELANTPVTALKSLFGNLSAGSGAVELAGSLLGLTRGFIPPSINYDSPDEECPVQVATGDPKPCQKPSVLALNQNSTGQAAAVVLTKE